MSGSFNILDIIQQEFIEETFRLLNNLQKQGVEKDFETETQRRLALFICFIIIMLIAFLTIWTPFVNKLNKDVVLLDYVLDLENKVYVDHYPHRGYFKDQECAEVPTQPELLYKQSEEVIRDNIYKFKKLFIRILQELLHHLFSISFSPLVLLTGIVGL